jgi:hypothetical protein
LSTHSEREVSRPGRGSVGPGLIAVRDERRETQRLGRARKDRNPVWIPVLDWKEHNRSMKRASKSMPKLLMSVTFAVWSMCSQSPCRSAETAPADPPAERTKEPEREGAGVLPGDQADRFPALIFSEAARAGLTIMSSSKVTTQTNGSFRERRLLLSLEATEPQFVDFLRNVAASNSTLRVQSLSLRPNPERTLLRVNVAITGYYRQEAGGSAPGPDSVQAEGLVVSHRRHLRQAALDCYAATKAALAPGWTLESLNFEDGKRLTLSGQAPAHQVSSLPEVQTKLQKAKSQDGNELFLPSSGDAAMRMGTAATGTFFWSIEFQLKQPEPR